MTAKCGCFTKVDIKTTGDKIEIFIVEVVYCHLHAAAPLMLQVLKMVEWKQNSNDDTVCPWCEWEWNTHHPDCPRQAAIAAAEKKVE